MGAKLKSGAEDQLPGNQAKGRQSEPRSQEASQNQELESGRAKDEESEQETRQGDMVRQEAT